MSEISEKELSSQTVRSGSQDRKERHFSYLFWLSIFLFIICFGMEGMLIFYRPIKNVDQEIIGRIMGTLDTISVTVCTFWFGSSLNALRSNGKDESR